MSQQENIKARAEQLWRELGCPSGRDEEIWLMAEEAVKTESAAAKAKPVTEAAVKPRATAAKKPATAKATTKVAAKAPAKK